MMVVLYSLCVIVFLKLVMVWAIRLDASTLSAFELRRRAKKGDQASGATLQHDELLGGLRLLQRGVAGALIVVLTTSAIAAFGWAGGAALSLALIVTALVLAATSVIASRIQRLYARYDTQLVSLIRSRPNLYQLLCRAQPPKEPRRITSRDELCHEIYQADGSAISDAERERLLASLDLELITVFERMAPIADVETLAPSELLGPLVLDDLHRTGQDVFPVVDGTQYLGVLSLSALTNITSSRHSLTAEQAMTSQVFYVHKDQSALSVFEAFMRTSSQVLFVIDGAQVVVGMITLKECLTLVTGQGSEPMYSDDDDPSIVAIRTT